MARVAAPIIALTLGAACAVALVSCGGGSNKTLLPGDTAAQIKANLDSVATAAAAGDCETAASDAEAVESQVNDLGKPVDHQLKLTLREGVKHLKSLVANSCEAPTTTPTETTAATTESETTEPATTNTHPTQTQTTATTPTHTTPTITTPPQTQAPPSTVPPPSGGVGAGGGHAPGKP